MNLLRNPFGELTRQQRVEAAVACIDPWIEYFGQPCHRERRALQFIGDCGRGKTTHLILLDSKFRDARYVYLPEDEPCPPIPRAQPCIVDEAQRLPRGVRRQLFSRGEPLILGTHRDFTRTLLRFGYQVETVDVANQFDGESLVMMLNRRIEIARLDSNQETPRVTVNDARWLIQRFGNNIREMESHLFTRLEEQKGSASAQVQFID